MGYKDVLDTLNQNKTPEKIEILIEELNMGTNTHLRASNKLTVATVAATVDVNETK